MKIVTQRMTRDEADAHVVETKIKMAEAIADWVREFKYISHAARSSGIQRETLSKICSGKVNQLSLDMLFKVAAKAEVELVFSTRNKYGRRIILFSTVEAT